MQNEVHLSYQVLFLITKPSLQACALSQNLNKTLKITTKIVNIQVVSEETLSGGIVLFDMIEADKRLIKAWQDSLRRKNDGIKLLLFNISEEYPFQDIEVWPHINGVFYSHDTEHCLTEGIQMVMCGECYFSQKLANYLITHAGNYRYNSMESTLLTQREKEILNRLRVGASNIEIARSLFISENTVKTHLYNLFKKIAVKNRTQAVSWANDNFKRQ